MVSQSCGGIIARSGDWVILTRKSDVFIELKDRPKKANSIDADLFVSIHCNSVKNPVPFGSETFVMGLARSKDNLEIAKQENSVILLEKDYKKTYKGFDPKNPETLIGLKILQEDYLDRSIILASKIEKKFPDILFPYFGSRIWLLSDNYGWSDNRFGLFKYFRSNRAGFTCNSAIQ